METRVPDANRTSSNSHVPLNRRCLLLSGGLDSATAGAIARAEGFELFALSVDYGQRHRFELDAAAPGGASTWAMQRHETVRIDLADLATAR